MTPDLVNAQHKYHHSPHHAGFFTNQGKRQLEAVRLSETLGLKVDKQGDWNVCDVPG